MGQIGRSVRRLEDRPLLIGGGRFAADIAPPDALHMRVVRSPVAFGRLTAIRVDAAALHPGVAAIWTAADVADIPPIDFRMTPVPGLEPYRQPVLACGHVCYVGEPIAAVFTADATRRKMRPTSSCRRSSPPLPASNSGPDRTTTSRSCARDTAISLRPSLRRMR